ncbi:alpha-ketoglutarate-dependent sulfonate dioxygenase [Lactarius quietus]|nr:alpha-ketoglutarate-dependent sulfonate dioxygenase [Lactarius quietus]
MAPVETATADDSNEQYKYAQYKPTFPVVSWEPLKEVEIIERGLAADPEKKNLLSAASKVITLTPAIGTELHGIDLRLLSDEQKDELSLLAAERGIVFLRNQDINIHELLDVMRYWGPLHKNARTPVPQEPGLEEVHVVYSDSSNRTDPTAKRWHTDVSFEIQPPGMTSLKILTGPETGGDTIWSSGYALYSSFSPGFQTYLEGLSAVHSAIEPAQNASAGGVHIRREPIETVHPVIRVHPATGWKSVFVNPSSTRRIIDVPKAESDAILAYLFTQIAESYDFQVRNKWEPNDVAILDNRVVIHTATRDFWPARRHVLRVTAQSARPISVADYERTTDKRARDRQLDLWERQGIQLPAQKDPLKVGAYGN